MTLREELTRQSLLLDFISECVGLQSGPDLARLVLSRLNWVCDYDSCTMFLPGMQGLSLWSRDRQSGAAVQDQGDPGFAPHRTILESAMEKGAPVVSCDEDSGMFFAALPLGSGTVVHGALCVARAGKAFSHGDIRHLQHAARAVGGALMRIAAVAAEREAERSVKLAELQLRVVAEDRVLLAEQMIGIVSHDLRNPLSAILMGATLMGKGDALSDHKERVLQKVHGATRRAQRLVEELLDFTQARVGEGLAIRTAEVDLDALMKSVADELQLSFSSLEVPALEKKLGAACLDADRIHQLLGNLVANAAMYGAPGQPIVLDCEIAEGDLTLSVCNKGKAIPEAMLATMFEPMIRGQGHLGGQRGVGLGLYIVRAIADAHQGTVSVTSSAEQGTRFSVRLPLDCRSDRLPRS